MARPVRQRHGDMAVQPGITDAGLVSDNQRLPALSSVGVRESGRNRNQVLQRIHRSRASTGVDAGVIQNAAYLDVVASGSGIVPRRKRRKALRDGDAGAEITPKDQSGYQFLQTRGYVVFDTSKSSEGDIGLVAGMFFLFSFFFFLIFLSRKKHAISTLTPKRQALTLILH